MSKYIVNEFLKFTNKYDFNKKFQKQLLFNIYLFFVILCLNL